MGRTNNPPRGCCLCKRKFKELHRVSEYYDGPRFEQSLNVTKDRCCRRCLDFVRKWIMVIFLMVKKSVKMKMLFYFFIIFILIKKRKFSLDSKIKNKTKHKKRHLKIQVFQGQTHQKFIKICVRIRKMLKLLSQLE